MTGELTGLEEFRTRVRAWAQEHVPAGWEETYRDADEEQLLEFQRQWLRQLREGGFAVPHWDRQHGGGGYSLAEQVVIFEEFARANAPRMRAFFVAFNHAYATLREGGTPEQQARLLPAILDGQTWCQGFSEPGAGSDLASLRTRAVREGDHYVVNGQKIWSSGASRSDYCLLLTRTDPDAPKRKGITFLLMDMRSPGIDVRPIKQATGQSEFSELFLTDVHVPVENRVGEENDGWRIAQATLSSERGPSILELGPLWPADPRWPTRPCGKRSWSSTRACTSCACSARRSSPTSSARAAPARRPPSSRSTTASCCRA
jgi:alkylation response protein AidB-like acyl-CoA dehydrogenase